MNTRMLLLLLAGLLTGRMAFAQAAGPLTAQMTAEQIAARMQAMNARRDAALKSYSSKREMTVDFKSRMGDGQATETVLMTFTAPSTKQFTVLSTGGSSFIRDNVFQREMTSEQAAANPLARQNAALTTANYDMRLVGQERLDVGDCYVFDVSPKTTSPFAFRGRVWVQGSDFAVAKIDAQPAQDPSTWVSAGRFRTVYEKVGDFYFPKETSSTSQILMGGEAALTIRYTDYRILAADPVR